MAFVVREPAIIAGRLRLRGESISSASEVKEIQNNEHLMRSCVAVPDSELAPVSLKPLPQVED